MYGIAGEHLTARLRLLMFDKLLQQEIAFFDDTNNSTGALCARLAGEAATVQGVTKRLIYLFVLLKVIFTKITMY